MLIRMVTTAAGSWSAKPGDVIDLESRLADELVSRGFAESVAQKPMKEKFVGPEENEQPRRGRKPRASKETS